MSKHESTKFAKMKALKGWNNFGGVNPSTLKNVRIIQKHLVYVIGLSSNLANKDVNLK
jgi:hypothetical protein